MHPPAPSDAAPPPGSPAPQAQPERQLEAQPERQPEAQPERQSESAAPPRRRSALMAGASDMVRSLLVIMALVVGLVLLVPRPTSVPRAAVDLPAAASGVADQLGFAPAVGVPAGWTVTSTRIRTDTGDLPSWSVNYLTDKGRYVGLEQAGGWDPRWLASVSQGGAAQGSTTIDGRQWSVYVKADKHLTSILFRGATRSTLVLAQLGGLDDARALAATLGSSL